MKELITSLFGVYTPITYTAPGPVIDGTVTEYDVVAGGFAGIDWTWLAGVALFGLTLYCVFRIIGGVINK